MLRGDPGSDSGIDYGTMNFDTKDADPTHQAELAIPLLSKLILTHHRWTTAMEPRKLPDESEERETMVCF
jgi:hypothetical protein